MKTTKLNSILENFSKLEKRLSEINQENLDQYAKLSKEYSDLKPLVEKINHLSKSKKELSDIEELISSDDIEIKNEALKEKNLLSEEVTKLENEIKFLLIPKDESDEKNAIIEIRAGTGGLEASLFASDLFKMYEKVSHKKKWLLELISISRSDAGGLKEVIASIKGRNIYSTLKYESGVHRVQRVPDTETQGRVHTSAATVAEPTTTISIPK